MSITFGQDVLRPSLRREPAYDSGRAPTGGYEFACASCGARIALDLAAFLGAAGGDDGILGSLSADRVREHFDLNLVGKSHDGGWPRLRVEACGHCGARYLVYAGVREPANGRYLVTVQGITELRWEPPAT